MSNKSDKKSILTQPFNSQISQNSFDIPYNSNDKKIVLPKYLQNNSAVTATGAAELIPFPQVDNSWYAGGLPATVKPPQTPLQGNLLDVVPIYYYTKVSKTFAFAPMAGKGFFLVNGVAQNQITTTYVAAGNLICIAMFDPYYYQQTMSGSTIHSEGYWQLLQDFGGIDAGSTANQTVNLNSGISSTEGQSMSYSIGLSAGIKATFSPIEISATLTTTLTNTLSTSVTVSQQQSVGTTVNYLPQPKAQRIGLYQFYRSYGITPSANTIDRVKNVLNAAYPDLNLYLATNTSYYATNHFQKVFVVDPS